MGINHFGVWVLGFPFGGINDRGYEREGVKVG